jgi:hypothetical protein
VVLMGPPSWVRIAYERVRVAAISG